MADYIIDIWKDDELVQSGTGKWMEDEARRLTLYYLGYYRGERAQLLRERSPDGRPAQDEVIAEVYAPQGAAGVPKFNARGRGAASNEGRVVYIKQRDHGNP